MAWAEDIERRVVPLEARVRAPESGMATVDVKLDGILGGQDVILGALGDQGRTLAEHGRILVGHDERFANHDALLRDHSARFDSVDAKLDLIVDWIQSQP